MLNLLKGARENNGKKIQLNSIECVQFKLWECKLDILECL